MRSRAQCGRRSGATNPADAEARHDSRRPRDVDAEQPGFTAPIRPSRRSARSRSGSPTMSSSDSYRFASQPRALDESRTQTHTGPSARLQLGRPSEITVGGSSASPEATVCVLPGARRARMWSSWLRHRVHLGLARPRGARPVGVDMTPAQLETARRMQQEFGLEFPLIEADGRDRPGRRSFDLVVSEYGASIWVDPPRWIPEAARLLRPRGDLVFLRNSTLVILCSPRTTGRRALVGRSSGWTASMVGRRRVPPVARRLDRLLRGTASRSSTSSRSRHRRKPRTHAYYDCVTRRLGAALAVRRRLEGAKRSARPRPAAPARVDEPAAAGTLDQLGIPYDVSRRRTSRRPAEGQRGPARARARPRQGALRRSAGRRSARARRRHRRRRSGARSSASRRTSTEPRGCSRSSPARHTSSSPASA